MDTRKIRFLLGGVICCSKNSYKVLKSKCRERETIEHISLTLAATSYYKSNTFIVNELYCPDV